MAISGLTILLTEEPAAQHAAVRALASHTQLALGPQVGARVAAMLDTPTPESDLAAVNALRALPGVLHLDVVCVFFPDDPDGTDFLADPAPGHAPVVPDAQRSPVTP